MHRVLCSGGPCGRPHPEWSNASCIEKSGVVFGEKRKTVVSQTKEANFACVRQELCQND